MRDGTIQRQDKTLSDNTRQYKTINGNTRLHNTRQYDIRQE